MTPIARTASAADRETFVGWLDELASCYNETQHEKEAFETAAELIRTLQRELAELKATNAALRVAATNARNYLREIADAGFGDGSEADALTAALAASAGLTGERREEG
jgi:hypothetical protein